MPKITNATERMLQAPNLLDGLPGMIEASEANGQRKLVASCQLPTSIHGDVKTLEQDGVVFGDVCKGDPLFRDATLPEGWEKRATDHSMWSELVDADGNVRASIFYKAAFYDRDAFIADCGLMTQQSLYPDIPLPQPDPLAVRHSDPDTSHEAAPQSGHERASGRSRQGDEHANRISDSKRMGVVLRA